MRVLKLGGSLCHGQTLPQWLALLARHADLIVVPGGGPFADQVRRVQQTWGFADACAHQMALLAMEQYGYMLCSLQPGLVAVTDQRGIDTALARGQTPVWLPAPMLQAAGLARDWTVTSDSLALWLTRYLSAQVLILIKSVQPRGPAHSLADLSADGVIDPAFAGLWTDGRPQQVVWAGSQQLAAVDEYLLGHGGLPPLRP